jgi:hypothetical protein
MVRTSRLLVMGRQRIVGDAPANVPTDRRMKNIAELADMRAKRGGDFG